MIPPWVADYVDIPWTDGGRSHAGCDCYGLVWLILREQFELELPSYVGAYTSAHEREEASSMLAVGIAQTGWRPVTTPRLGDGVLLRVENRPWHVGLMVSADQFVHVTESLGASAIERLDSHRWKRRVLGLYRHEALA